MSVGVLEKLKRNNLLQDVSHLKELSERMSRSSITFYCGFDPTADSLHVGHLLAVMVMRKLQKAGHRPIALIGTATGMIGDPSGKSEERKLLRDADVKANADAIANQIKKLLDLPHCSPVEIVRNDQWTSNMSCIDFLRDIGKYFSVNTMLARDSVKQRLENREQGISYTEFSYMLLQAYDFYWLNQQKDCELQIGGSDQWGNIVAGIDLVHKRSGNSAAAKGCFGMTFPLIKSSSGVKFGKTEAGAVWLDPKKTSPYRFYQFWINTPDADVANYLRYFTELEESELNHFDEQTRNSPETRASQKFLAAEITRLTHGETELARAIRASEALFGGDLQGLEISTIEEIFHDVPSTTIDQCALSGGMPILDLLIKMNVASSKSAARRLIESGGCYLNNQRLTDFNCSVGSDQLLDGQALVVRSGKKSYYLLRVVDDSGR